ARRGALGRCHAAPACDGSRASDDTPAGPPSCRRVRGCSRLPIRYVRGRDPHAGIKARSIALKETETAAEAVDRHAVAAALREIAKLLAAEGNNRFRSRAYERAAR